MAFSSSSSSLLLHFKVSIPHTKNPFHRFSSNYCLVPTKIFPKCCSISSKSSTFFKCYSQRQSTEQKNEETEGKNGYQEQVYDFERLFSNLNQATLKREPGISLFQDLNFVVLNCNYNVLKLVIEFLIVPF